MAKFTRAAAVAVILLGITAIFAEAPSQEPFAAIDLVPIIVGIGGLGVARYLDV